MSDHPAGRVTSEIIGRVLKITIDNPAQKNAISPDMRNALSDALTALDDNDALWVGVICATGDHFTTGLDMPKFFGPKATATPFAKGNVDPLGLDRRCRKPIITAIQGYCFTVGIEIALAGDILIADETARFSQMEVKRGIAPLGGAHFRYLTRMGWGDAMYHLLTADQFDAARALKIGLVQEVVPPGTQTDRAMELAGIIARNAPIGVQVTKEAAQAYVSAAEAEARKMLPEIRNRVMGSKDMLEGIQSFVERRDANFSGQ